MDSSSRSQPVLTPKSAIGSSEPSAGESMVERVARAIEPYVWTAIDAGRLGDHHVETVKLMSLGKARKAIEAMREPTHEMSEVALDEFDWGPPGYDDAPQGEASPELVWQVMIDAALNPTTAETGR